MSTTAYKIEIMEAFENGEEIEFQSIRTNNKEWLPATSPAWDWFNCEYRVKINEPFWEPKKDEEAYWITTVGESIPLVSSDNLWSQAEINMGRAYKTKEDAEQAIKVKLAEQRLKKAIYTTNDNREYPFIDETQNWYILLNGDILTVAFTCQKKFMPNWFYCKNKEVAEQILQECGVDLVIYLNQ